MTVAHILGFPRIGAQRELKQVLERYWKGESTPATLEEAGRDLRARHWQWQRAAGLDSVAVGDFSFYDHVLDTSALLGVVPARFAWQGGDVDLDTYFRMARGVARNGAATTACEMTKWFDTNYHYLVPELVRDQVFRVSSARLFEQSAEAVALGHRANVGRASRARPPPAWRACSLPSSSAPAPVSVRAARRCVENPVYVRRSCVFLLRCLAGQNVG